MPKTLKRVLTAFSSGALIFKGSLLWNSLSDDTKTSQSLAIFKQKSDPGMGLIARVTSAEINYLYTFVILIISLFSM